MKIALLFLLTLVSVFSIAQVRVKGYYKKNGTYVQPHVRSSPDGSVSNNWSTKGNINHYTGKEGTKNIGAVKSNEYNYTQTNNTTIRNTTIATVEEKPQGSIEQDPTVNSSSISVVYFEKIGSEFEESFSLKNNTNRTVGQISIRLIYYLDGEVLDYRDLVLNANIPSGLAKKFTIRSFDQGQNFTYKHGNDRYKDFNALFDVKYVILNYN
ncbi:hypothetical protein [Bacteroides neonati]|uniref:hypothetical protein n=1 Tax=Bacteroides neonati TaxID=1347393 RepID=UPI0004B37F6A|nr:hypothetical protein [Bacteroides neonati]